MKKVLIIDDDQFILKVYQKKFETEGLKAEVAADGPSALAALRANVPELVLLDLMLPGMNGVELLGHIRTLPGCGDLPVIVFSHSYDDRMIEAARNAGALQCLNKNSVSPNRLIEIIRAAVASGDSPAARDDFRNQLVREAPTLQARLQVQLQAFSGSPSGPGRTTTLTPLRESFTRLCQDADRADFNRLALLTHATGRMLEDLLEHPEEINAGTFRTLSRVVETLPGLFVARPAGAPEVPSMALIVHEQRGVAPLLAESLRTAGQPAVAFRDPTTALGFIEENPVDILVTSLELAQPNGGDFVRRAQAIPGRAQLPAVLLSNQPPGAFAVPNFLVAHQVLSFPFTAEEVVVSTIARLQRRG